jgi:hypothetical protein
MKLLEDYTAELKSADYLHKYAQRKHPTQVDFPGKNKPEYMGNDPAGKNDACMACHPEAFKVWAKSKHAGAYPTLVNAKRPSNRQFDPECVVCHTVGFAYESGFEDVQKTPLLTNVGCESCHGPCSEHVLNPNDKAWHKVINPWKYMPKSANPRQKMEDMCITCHDHENDVNWKGENAFDKKWDFVKHYTPKKNTPAKDK